MFQDNTVDSMTDKEVCARIEQVTVAVMGFWKSAQGWATVEAAGLLSNSMLEWQASLAGSLAGWLSSAETDGNLILAWANLGALVEGQLKLFLSVYYKDYTLDVDAIKRHTGAMIGPDEANLEQLRQFFVKRIWSQGADWNPYIKLVQQRRNAIHAFRSRDIGDFDEWRLQTKSHLKFILDLNSRLPYPDDVYSPRDF